MASNRTFMEEDFILFFSGGGVYVSQNGTFTMKGGSVEGNTVPFSGGGVYVNSGTFTMEDGAITGNIAPYDGGGVYVSQNGTFTMEDGSFAGNKAGSGGGVYVNSGTFTMKGGAIQGNTASDNGGGVCLWDSAAITKTGGTIYGTAASADQNKVTDADGSTVYTDRGAAVWVGKFQMDTGQTVLLVLARLEKTVNAAHNLTKTAADDTTAELTAGNGWDE
jgi:parallel beta-helix repeat protein